MARCEATYQRRTKARHDLDKGTSQAGGSSGRKTTITYRRKRPSSATASAPPINNGEDKDQEHIAPSPGRCKRVTRDQHNGSGDDLPAALDRRFLRPFSKFDVCHGRHLPEAAELQEQQHEAGDAEQQSVRQHARVRVDGEPEMPEPPSPAHSGPQPSDFLPISKDTSSASTGGASEASVTSAAPPVSALQQQMLPEWRQDILRMEEQSRQAAQRLEEQCRQDAQRWKEERRQNAQRWEEQLVQIQATAEIIDRQQEALRRQQRLLFGLFEPFVGPAPAALHQSTTRAPVLAPIFMLAPSVPATLPATTPQIVVEPPLASSTGSSPTP